MEINFQKQGEKRLKARFRTGTASHFAAHKVQGQSKYKREEIGPTSGHVLTER